jgi:hypothetical protein
VAESPRAGRCAPLSLLAATTHWANVIMSVQDGPVESHLPPHPIDLINAQRRRAAAVDTVCPGLGKKIRWLI